jgi:hypothetical protein
MLNNPLGFLFYPKRQWQLVANATLNQQRSCTFYAFFFALLPCIAWYHGVTEVGWRVAEGEIVRLTPRSALLLISAFYAAIILALTGIGSTIHWMAGTYGSIASFTRGFAIAVYGATPLFIAGCMGFYPLLWLDMTLGILAVSWAVYLLYTGVPIVMGIPAERGFLYASAVIAVCLVFLMAMMGATVILWEMGLMPEFTD